jgi:hypothetical protein
MNYPYLPNSNPRYKFDPETPREKLELILTIVFCLAFLLWVAFVVVAKYRGWL